MYVSKLPHARLPCRANIRLSLDYLAILLNQIFHNLQFCVPQLVVASGHIQLCFPDLGIRIPEACRNISDPRRKRPILVLVECQLSESVARIFLRFIHGRGTRYGPVTKRRSGLRRFC